VRILIADDNDHVRRGVAAIVSSQKNWIVCGEARDGAEAIQRTFELKPDLILLDVSLPDMSGLQVARRVRDNAPETKILVISNHDAQYLYPRVLQAGGDACLDKSRLATDLLETIRKIEASI
jgi:two-component system, NarL family, response regulator NreC